MRHADPEILALLPYQNILRSAGGRGRKRISTSTLVLPITAREWVKVTYLVEIVPRKMICSFKSPQQ